MAERKNLPADLPGRLGYVGVALYDYRWRARLAAGLGISRTTLHQWMTGGKRDPQRDIDAEIADLIDRERGAVLTELRNKFLRAKRAA